MFRHIQLAVNPDSINNKDAEVEVRLAFAAPDLYRALLNMVRDYRERGFHVPDEAIQALIAATGYAP